MKSITPRKTKKTIMTVTLLLVTLLIAAGIYFLLHNNFFNHSNNSKSSSINLKKPTPEQVKAGNKQKQVTTDASIKNSQTPTGTENSTPSPLTITITAFNQNGDQVQIRSLIDMITSTGSCTLTLEGDGETITKSSAIQALPSSSSCKGFDLPTSELSPGPWTATITVSIGSQTSSASKTLTIQ